jgi:hypothetical protein
VLTADSLIVSIHFEALTFGVRVCLAVPVARLPAALSTGPAVSSVMAFT